MGIHPYCVTPADTSPAPGLQGLDDAPVRAVGIGDVAVWTSELETAPVPSVPTLRSHDAVIRAAARAGVGGPLPVRFGGWVRSRQTLERRIRERHEPYLRALERLGDAREYALRILEPQEDPGGRDEERPVAGARSGTEYMERLARRHAERDRRERHSREVLGRLREAVGETAADERVERPAEPPALLSVAHLVRRDDVDEYRGRIERFRRDHPRLRAVSTGPWAAYSFAP